MEANLELQRGAGRRTPESVEMADLEDVSDPRVERDETETRIRDHIRQHPWLSFFAALLTATLTIWFGFVMTNIAPWVLTNPTTHRFLAITAIFIGGGWLGWRRHRSVAEATDELVLFQDNRIRRFRGEFEPSEGSAPLFVPYKGLRGPFRFLRGNTPFSIDDVAPGLVRPGRPDLSGDDPAVIMVTQGGRSDGSLYQTVETDTGIVVSVLSGDLQLYRGGRNAVLRTTIPSTVHEQQLADIESALASAEEDRKQAEERAETFKAQRDKALELSRNARDEVLDEFIENVVELEEARRQGSSGSDDSTDQRSHDRLNTLEGLGDE